MADATVNATAIINVPAQAIFAVLADPIKHAAIDGHRLGPRAFRQPAADRGGAGVPDGHVPRRPPRRELPDGQPGAGVRPAARHRLGVGSGSRRQQPAVRRLDLALRPGSGRAVRDQGHPVLRLVGGPRLPPPAHRIPPFPPDHLRNSLAHLAGLVTAWPGSRAH